MACSSSSNQSAVSQSPSRESAGEAPDRRALDAKDQRLSALSPADCQPTHHQAKRKTQSSQPAAHKCLGYPSILATPGAVAVLQAGVGKPGRIEGHIVLQGRRVVRADRSNRDVGAPEETALRGSAEVDRQYRASFGQCCASVTSSGPMFERTTPSVSRHVTASRRGSSFPTAIARPSNVTTRRQDRLSRPIGRF